MDISGGNSFFIAANKDRSDLTRKSILADAKQAASKSAEIKSAARDLYEEIDNNRSGYEMAQENVDMSMIWQRGRDWGLDVQQDIVNRARELAVRASSPLLTDQARKIIGWELDSLKAEMTRIGLSNNINGSFTLARYDKVETVEEVEVAVEETTVEVTEIKPQIDVLWVMDRSGSLGDDIAALRKDAPKMFNALEDKGFDVRMAIRSFETNLDDMGSDDFKDNIVEFQADVDSIVIGGGFERGILATEQAMDVFGEKFRPDATKVTVLITDEDSDDFPKKVNSGWWGGVEPKNSKLHAGSAAEKLRQGAADALKDAGSEFFVVGNNDYRLPDKDYQDIVEKVGNGGTIKLDHEGRWVDTVTDNFIASVERDIKEGKFSGVVKKQVISTEYKLQDEWDLKFQVGPDSGDHIVETFKTSVSRTSGLDKADFSTPEKARESIDTIGGASNFLIDNQVQVGTLQTRFNSIADNLANRSIYDRKPFTVFTSAFNTYSNFATWGKLPH